MTTEVEQAVEQPVEVDSNDGFEAGFAEARGDEPPAQLETPPNEPVEDNQPEPEPRPEPEPEVDQIALLKEEIASLRNQQQQQTDKAFGKLGEVFRELQHLKQSKPAGFELSDEDLEDAFSDYPELRKDQLKAFKAFAKKLSGGAQPVPQQQIPVQQPQYEEVQPQVSDIEREANLRLEERRKAGVEALQYIHPDADQIKSSPAFLDWLGKQPKEIIQQAATSLDVQFAAKVISDFKASSVKKETKQKRLEAAVTPQGVQIDGPPATTDEDDFNSGFAGIMKRRI